jgi:thiamine-monophosphate kinase
MNKDNNNEASKPKLTPVSALGEFGLIGHLTNRHVLQHPESVKGIGDDAAVLQPTVGKQTLISTDMLVEGIHFDLMYTPLKHLGYKSVVVNLSDIYAMNGIPKQITVSIALSSRFTVEALEELYDGIYTACRLYDIDLIGGDTTSSNKGLIISITAIGEADADKVVYRNTAKVGDHLFVTGDLGGAYLGLQLLEREKSLYLDNPNTKPEIAQHEYPVQRQLRPEARKDIIEILADKQIVPTAMIDVSDGLSSELLHICKQSQVGCQIYEENLPIHPKTFALSQEFKLAPTTCALNGGEDYELLFSVSPSDYRKLEGIHGIASIGKVVAAEAGTKLYVSGGKSYDLVAQGWQHL